MTATQPKQNSYALRTDNMSFTYPGGHKVIENLNLSIEPGSLTALLGPNGAGKSTLLRLLSGASRPTSGKVLVNGTDISSISKKELARLIAFVPQDVLIRMPFTCREIVEMGRYARTKGLKLFSSCREEIVGKCLEDTGTAHLADKMITEISGGEAQRVRIAQALAQEAEVLILDEPTAHLDISFQIEILDLVKRLNQEKKLTVIAALHDMNLASMYCQNIVVFRKGQIAAQGTPDQVITPELLRDIFQVRAEVTPASDGTPRLFLLPGKNTLESAGT